MSLLTRRRCFGPSLTLDVCNQVQYAARAAVFHLGEKTETGAQLQGLQKGLGLHRKAFKLGMFLDEGLKFLEALNNPKLDDTERFLTLLIRVSMCIFQVYDNLLWALEVKFVKNFDKANIKMRSYQFRLIAALAQMVQVLLNISKQQDAVEKLAQDDKGKPEDLVKAREKQGQNVWKAIKNGCDCVTYGQSADVLQSLIGKTLDDGVIGVLGAVSAFAGLVEIWVTKVKAD
jgi:hypothetical protein